MNIYNLKLTVDEESRKVLSDNGLYLLLILKLGDKMTQIKLMDKYPVFTKKIVFNKTAFKNIDEIIEYLHQKILAHPIAVYIGVFDHYSYTTSLESYEISEDILDAKNIMCCFGDKLLMAEVPAVRPRSFSVVLTKDSFVISFLEAPSPVANATMVEWVDAIEDI